MMVMVDDIETRSLLLCFFILVAGKRAEFSNYVDVKICPDVKTQMVMSRQSIRRGYPVHLKLLVCTWSGGYGY
jgi:hypothetical protein